MNREKKEQNRHSENRENFFWNLFLQTGRIDAYLLLKEEELEHKNETKP